MLCANREPNDSPPPIPFQCYMYRGHVPHTVWKAAFSTLEHFAAQKRFSHPPPPPPDTISFPLACIVNILRYQRFYRVNDNFLWVLGLVVMCLSHQTGLSIVSTTSLCPCSVVFEIDSADDSFCLRLTSTVILFILSKTKQKTDPAVTSVIAEI